MRWFVLVLAVAFWPGIADPATAPRWALASVALPFLAFARPVSSWGTGHTLFGVWLIYASVSICWSPVNADAAFSLWCLNLMFLAFCQDESDEVWDWFRFGIVVSSLIAFAQNWGWQGLPQASPPAGLFMNKNVLAEAAVLALIGCRKRTPLDVLLVTTVLIAESRAAYLSLAILAYADIPKAYRSLLVCAGTVVLLAVITVGPGREWTDFLSAATLKVRFSLWYDTLSGLTWFGHGIGSFFADFPTVNQGLDIVAERPEHPHNELVLVLFELGIGALAPVALFSYIVRASKFRERVFACVPLLLFGFPLQTPVGAIMLAYLFGGMSCGRGVVERANDRRGVGVSRGDADAGEPGHHRHAPVDREGHLSGKPFTQTRACEVRGPGARRNFGFGGCTGY